MLHSLLTTHPRGTFAITLLHGGDLAERRLARVERMVNDLGGELRVIEVPDERVEGFEVIGFTRKATWYRLFLPELLPQADRLLYLDADLLVVDDLRPLWSLPLDDQYLAAATNVIEPHFSGRMPELGIEPEDYFNAGVLMLNLDLMRADDCSTRMVEVARKGGAFLFWRDQDVLNLVLRERRHRLHPRFNCMNILRSGLAESVHGEQAVQEALAQPAIRHFEGPEANKPWHVLTDPADRRAYAAHRRETPWPRYVPEGLSLSAAKQLLRRRLRP